MKTISPIIASLLLALAIAGVGYLSITTYQELKTKELNNEARFQCAQSSRYQTTDEKTGVTVWYPEEQLYAKCLSEKGLK